MEQNGEMEQQEMGVIKVPQHQQHEEVEQAGGNSQLAPRPPPIKCARCDSPNTKFCYFNNYNENQPRFYCKTCRRYWTQGGSLRDIPIGGTSRRDKKSSKQALPIVNPLSDPFPAAAIDPPIGPFPAAAINPSSNPFPAEAVNPFINYVPAAACNPPNNPFPAAAINPLSNLFPTSAINHMSIPLSAAVVAPLSYSFPAAAINPLSNPFPAAATIVSGATSTPSLKIIEPGTISTQSLALTPHAHSTHIPGFESPPIVAEVQTLNQLTVMKGSALTLSSGINPPSYGLQHQQYQHITYSQAIYMDEVDNSLSQWFLCSEQGRVPPNMHSATTSGLQPIFNNSNNIIGSEAILWSTNNSNDAIGSPKSPYYWSEAPGSDPPSA